MMPSYKIKDIPSPLLSGPPLNAFVKILESSRVVRRSVMALNNLGALQSQSYAEAPLFLPISSPSMFDLEMKKQKTQGGEPKLSATNAYQQAYQTRAVTPSQMVDKVLEQIQASNAGPEPLQAIIAVHEASLRKAAEASSQRYRQTQPLSPLDGVPIAVKSEIFVENLRSQAGTSFLEVPAEHPEATIIARLREAGALIVGLTNMHEIGIGVTGANIHQGVVRNPYDKKRHTGGSSSGSAAAVAAGLVPIAIGSDGGGSIRIPSSLCGVVGLKPSFFRLSSFGSFPSCATVSQSGPIANQALDCARAYQIMAGVDPLDGKTRLQPPPSLRGLEYVEDLSDMTAGIYAPWFEHANAEVVALCQNMLQALKKRGLKVVAIDIPELEEARVAHFITIAAEMFSFMKPHMAQHRAELSPSTRFALALGSEITSTDYIQAQRARQRAIHHLEDIFEKVDVIVSPACATAAPMIAGPGAYRDVLDTVLMGRLMRFAQLFNLTGNPGISFPAGYSSQGLPVGIQFGGRWWAEADLLRIARAAEGLVPRVLPPNHWPIL